MEGGVDNLRSVTELVLQGVPRFSDLNTPSREKTFLELLSGSLSSCEALNPSGERGAYVDLYFPEIDGVKVPVVVKVLKDEESRPLEGLKARLSQIDHAEFQQTLDEPGLVLFHNRDKKVKFEDLNEKEKLLVVTAWEHRKHEELFGPFVVPAVFVSFVACENITADVSFIPEGALEVDKGWLSWARKETATLKSQGKLTEDGKEIYINKGQIVYAMVQNFVKELSPSVFRLPEEYPVTEGMIRQLEDFSTTVARVLEETGYYPDPSMDHAQSQNLRFTPSGKLILIDTNSLRKREKDGDGREVVWRLNKLMGKLRGRINK